MINVSEAQLDKIKRVLGYPAITVGLDNSQLTDIVFDSFKRVMGYNRSSNHFDAQEYLDKSLESMHFIDVVVGRAMKLQANTQLLYLISDIKYGKPLPQSYAMLLDVLFKQGDAIETRGLERLGVC